METQTVRSGDVDATFAYSHVVSVTREGARVTVVLAKDGVTSLVELGFASAEEAAACHGLIVHHWDEWKAHPRAGDTP